MSAGELEHEWAGTPGRLIRERYRRAAELSRVRGKLSCLLINDIDAGLGRFENTQVQAPRCCLPSPPLSPSVPVGNEGPMRAAPRPPLTAL